MSLHRTRAVVAALATLLVPAAAAAQSSGVYVLTDSPTPYAALPAGTGHDVFTGAAGDVDDGFSELSFTGVAPAFSFRYFGRTYSKIWVSANGAISFTGVDSVTGQLYPVPGDNRALPDARLPNALLAAFWDDWVVTSRAPGGGRVAWDLQGTGQNRRLVIDWQHVQLYGATGATAPTYSFQLVLVERTGQWEVRVGPHTGDDAVSLLSATSAAENFNATSAVTHYACSPNCRAADLTVLSSDTPPVPLPLPSRLVSPNQNPELSLSLAVSGAANGGPRAIVTVRNGGQSTATGVYYELYASTDAVLDDADVLVYRNTTPLEVGILTGTSDNSTVAQQVNVPLPPDMKGAHYIVGMVDPGNTIVELNRDNNLAASATTFIAGTDLTLAMTGQASGIVGERVTFNFSVTNPGVRAATGVIVRLRATSTLLEEGSVLLLQTSPFDVGAESVATSTHEVVLPTTWFPGSYSLSAVVDPDDAVEELSNENNAAPAATIEVRGPDVGVLTVASGSRIAYQGLSVPVRVTLQNKGSGRAENFRFAVFLSANDVITLRDIKVFSSAPVTLEGNTQRVITEAALIPASTPIGTYYVGIIVDAEGVVLETDRTNNVRRAADQVIVSPAVPDLTVSSLAVKPTAAAGEYARLSALVSNIGADTATETPYQVYLSSNATVSTRDLLLGEGLVTLDAGAQRVIAADVRVPSFVAPGVYTVGVLLDPANALFESDESNNTALAVGALTVVKPALGVTTPVLPDGVAGLPYELRLSGQGGNSAYAWSVAGGALPAGLSLSTSGVITGTPRAQGVAAVVVRLTSGALTVDRSFTLSVRAYAASLGLLETRLPSARRSTPYEVPLGASGGNAPYRFLLGSGALPNGLTLTEAGVLAGIPTVAAQHTFTVIVEDNAGHRAAGEMSLEVLAESGGLSFRQSRLAEPEAGRAYTGGRLAVSGGILPYSASLFDGQLPPGLTLAVDGAGSSVALVGTPTTPGVYTFGLVVSDARGERGTAHFVLRVNPRKLTFVTALLPSAAVGDDYRTPLESNARQPAAYAIIGGDIPPGLAMDAAGVIAGTVETGAARRVYAFAVRVQDQEGGEAIAPFAINIAAPRLVEPPAASGGCSSTGVAGLWPLALGAFFLARRRRSVRGLAFVAAVFASLQALPADAFYRVSRTSETFTQLSSGTTLISPPATEGTTPVTEKSETLPFPFRFFGTTYSTVSVSSNGYLVFGAQAQTVANTRIPSTDAPANFIAPFWDDLRLSTTTAGGASLISWSTTGTTPSRVTTIEWRNLQRNVAGQSGVTYAAYSFQVKLYEGSFDVVMSYGGAGASAGIAPTLTASMGIENQGGTAGFEVSDANCSPACTAANFPVNTSVRLRLAPDLIINAVSAPPSIFAGTATRVVATVTNAGGAVATNTRLRFLLSTDTLVDSTDYVLGEATYTGDLTSSFTATVPGNFTAPTDLPPGRYQLLARVDPTNAIAEVDEDNNDAAAVPVGLAPRAPDFVVTRLLGSTNAQPGRTYALTRTIRNQGNERGAFEWTIVLSTNAEISAADLEIASGEGVLDPDGVLDTSDNVMIPASLMPGAYWLGMLVRSAAGGAELDALNNDRVLGPLTIRGDSLAIDTLSLPEVVAGVPFSIQLGASGGIGDYRWSGGFPSLPASVTVTESGILSGILGTAGDYRFQVQVLSGGTLVSAVLTARAVGQSTPLAVVSSRLRLGAVAARYVGYLAAQGGRPPYSWRLAAGSALPAGLVLASDGAVEGVPRADGQFVFRAEVTDSSSTPVKVSGEVTLPIAGPTRPLFATTSLPAAAFGTPFTTTFDAAGGTAPYRFTVVESRRVPTSSLDTCDASDTCTYVTAPPGLTLAEDGTLSGTPTRIGLYAITVRLTDSASFEDTATYLLPIESGSTLEITTGTLRDGIVNQSYEEALTVVGANGAVTWHAVLLDGAGLPSGLDFTAQGVVVGLPLEPGFSSFLAVARDDAGRLAMRPVGIRVVAAPLKAESQGCQQVDASWVLLLVVGAWLVRRRIPRVRLARSAGPVTFAAVLVLAGMQAGCKQETVSCPQGCDAPFVCDPLDNLCKCGGQGGAICGAGQTCDAAAQACLVATCDETCAPPTVCGTDGLCRCGSPTGPICGGGETCGTFGRCETADPCEGVACAGDMTCDSADGRCTCGFQGATCAAGEQCLDGACRASKCTGVACSGGTACDAADGICKCGGAGGAVCVNGEACDPVNARCTRVDRCEHVTCGAGLACDPADGRCYCGGPGGPRCGIAQSCEPVARRCLGGDLCAGVSCSGSLSCDPEDGICKCGGFGGEVCAASRTCIPHAGGAKCEQPCDPFGAACGAGLACRYAEAAALSYCVEAGTETAGAFCTPDAGCADTFHCRLATNAIDGVCRKYCLSNDGCAAGEQCRAFQAGSALGLCLTGTP